MFKLSVVLATKNEENNIGSCLESVKDIADEIIIIDEFSTDKTVEIAKKFGAKTFEWEHDKNFHQTKQMAIEKAKGDWILQLDADERVTPELSKEIKSVLVGNHPEFVTSSISKKEKEKKEKLFVRHQKLIKEREGRLGKESGDVVAYFMPRVNYFIGKPLIHAGVYPDGVIRLIKRGKARLPAKSVHELMDVDGKVEWLYNDLEHHESPTLRRYFARANRYTDITAQQFETSKLPKNAWNLFKYSILIPTTRFLILFVRHRGYKDGIRGFLWSAFSAFHFPLAYWKYCVQK